MMFSIPLNQKLNEQQFNEFLKFCSVYKKYIYDIYFTSRMPPFTQDAMGDIINIEQAAYSIFDTAIYIQNSLGITVSATFNNIKVPPTQKNLDLFIKNFKYLYDAGIRSATIPHVHWVATKQIQKAFPDLFIKNTILRNVTKANDVVNLAKVGFNYINLDRDLMRDHQTLSYIRKAADRVGVKISLLGNEGCLGGCPVMDEHFEFNNSRVSGPAYFNDPISRVSCPKWDFEDGAVPLKTANFPPWREDWVEILNYVDVIKMHGRESVQQIFNTMNIIKKFANNDEILFDGFEEYLIETNLKDRPIDAWRKIIKNCKFECWDCNFCDKLYEKKSVKSTHPLIIATINELVDSVNYKNNINIPGLTSSRVQNFIFGICSHARSYLEIGSAMGATAAAAGANDLLIHCVDSWKENIQAEKEDGNLLPNNTKEEFIKNTSHIKNLYIHDCSYKDLDTSKIKDIEVFFYDGPHDVDNTYSAIKKVYDCLSNTFVIILDDANWEGVVTAAENALIELGAKKLYNKLILNDAEDKDMWWNGIYIAVIEK